MIPKEELGKYPLKKQLVINTFEAFHGDYHEADPIKYATFIRSLERREVNQCYYCYRVGIDVNRYAHYHVGGKGNCSSRCCDDIDKCQAEQNLNREKEETDAKRNSTNPD